MIELTITNAYGETLEVNESNKLAISNIDGLSAPKFNLGTKKVGKDGVYVTSRTINEREITITFDILGSVKATRQTLYNFCCVGEVVILKFKTFGEFEIRGSVIEYTPSWFENQSKASVTIFCDDPYFYDLEDTVYNLSPSPLTVAHNSMLQVEPIIEMHLISSASAINVTFNNLTLTVTHNFNAGDLVTIDNKRRTVYVNNTINVYHQKSGDWLFLQKGDNYLSASQTSAAIFKKKYIGI